MCCFLGILAFLGPRLTVILWWFMQPSYFSSSFTALWWPILGLMFLPWLTLMYLLVAPGGINGLDMLWLALALILDLSTYGGGAYGNRDRCSR